MKVITTSLAILTIVASVTAQGAVVGVERERLTSWITLYKSVGGAWKDASSHDSSPRKAEIFTKASQ